MLEGYSIDRFGVISQVNKNPIEYNSLYLTKYDKQLTESMSFMRLGYIIKTIKKTPNSLMDVGFGNGSFLRVANSTINNTAGYDVYNNEFLPTGCKFETSIIKNYYEVITFFDSLEHISDLSFLQSIKCNYLVVSVPNCNYQNDNWFSNWKHRKYNEHLHHFNLESLTNLMNYYNFIKIDHSYFEDSIRRCSENSPNILSCVFQKNEHK